MANLSESEKEFLIELGIEVVKGAVGLFKTMGADAEELEDMLSRARTERDKDVWDRVKELKQKG
jgi:hypothetical protein